MNIAKVVQDLCSENHKGLLRELKEHLPGKIHMFRFKHVYLIEDSKILNIIKFKNILSLKDILR